jgi:hypothetical protein
MRRNFPAPQTLALLVGLLFAANASSQEKSGLQQGEFLPGSFAPYNLNGPSKGLHHSLVCEYGLGPVVMVFVRERRDGKDKAALELLQKLDEVLPKYQPEGLRGFAVVLSPDARSSVFEEKTEDVDKVLEEEDRREKLQARLEPLAGQLKNLVLTTYPAEGPKGYNLSAKAEVTVILYERMKVRENWAFREGQLNAEGIAQVMQGIEKVLRPSGKQKGGAKGE